jgi:cytochrome d ubiquinol oxidase subunit I
VLAELSAAGTALLAATDPEQLLPARQQMAFTLGFHIILVPFGVAFTFLMLMVLARRWSQVAGVLFAVGAVSGTVLSFELGLLWPGLMGRYGAAFGIPFAVEGLFFFLEAIFVAIYLYGWQRMRPWPHFFSGVPIVLAGIGGTASVVAANGWMNQPAGFTVRDGQVTDVRPLEVFFNRAFWYEALHMLLAAYMVAGFVIAGVYAVGMLRGHRDRLHRLGLAIPFTVAAIATPVQIFVGDVAAREVFANEPAKFAAIELLPRTGTHVPEVLLGVLVDGQVRYGIEIPSGASILAGYVPSTRILGLDAIPAEYRPRDELVTTVHLAFDVMVGIGFALLLLAAWWALTWWRRREMPRSRLFLLCTAVSGVLLSLWYAVGWWRRRSFPENRWFLRLTAVAGVLTVVALEAGWVTTEVGRQPWTVVGQLLTRDAVNTSGNLWLFFGATVALYAAVAVGTVYVLRLLRRRWAAPAAPGDGGAVTDEDEVPYGPSREREAVTSRDAAP